MKHLFITLCLLSVALFSSAQGEKTALLITHYGSSDPDTRALTLDVITREAKETFPQFEVREAYISPIVRRRLEKQGVHKDSPVDALLKLRSEGYSRVLIQSTTLIEGSEMTSVRRDAESVKPFFKEIKVGNPLLYTVEDCEKVIEILTQEQPGKKEDVIYVGHGNYRHLRHAGLYDESPRTEKLPRQHHRGLSYTGRYTGTVEGDTPETSDTDTVVAGMR